MAHAQTRRAALLAVAAVAVSAAALAAGSPAQGAPVVEFRVGTTPAVVTTASKVELLHTGFKGAGEPTIGVAKDGTVYTDVTTSVIRSTDHGRHWIDVTPPGHLASLDPYLYVDPATSRVYKSDLAGTCQVLSWSDDRGQSWTTAPAACNQSDHQTIAAGPPVAGLPTVGYPNVLYNCSQTLGYNGYSLASGCARSLDGGLSWTPSGSAAYSDPSPYGVGAGSGDGGAPGHCNGDIGPIAVDPKGTLYVPRGWCGQPWLAISKDAGTTWTRTQVAKTGMNTTVTGGFGLVLPGAGQPDHEAAVMADGKGHVFYFWVALDRQPYLAISSDGGAHFGTPRRVSPPQVREAWGPSIDIDASGRLAFAYMGSTNSPGKPWTGSYATTDFSGWLAVMDRPLDPHPAIRTGNVGKPLARGACGPDRCNDSILDFIDVELGPDGAAYGAFVDSYPGGGDELVVGRLGR